MNRSASSTFHISLALPAFLILLFGAGAWIFPEGSGVLAPNGLDANPGTTGPDEDCPAGSNGGGAQPSPPTPPQTVPCPVVFSIDEPVPMPQCPDEGFGVVIPKAAGVSNQTNTFGPYDENSLVAYAATAYDPPEPGEPGIDSPFVDAVSGHLTVVQGDLVLPGQFFDLLVTRTYRSGNYDYDSVAGLGWEISTNRSIEVSSRDAFDAPLAFEMAAGSGTSTEAFTRDSGTDWFTGARGGVAEYDATADAFILYHRNGTEEEFSSPGSTDWYLPEAYRDTWGKSISASYATSTYSPTGYELDVITDDIGRTLTFSYDANHGRLVSIVVDNASSIEIARIDYTYLERANGQVTLEKVEGLEIATEDSSQQLTFVRQVWEFTYSHDTTHDAWLLEGLKNGKGEFEYKWFYDPGSGGQVLTQKDRPGSTIRPDGEGVHSYAYNTGVTDYTGPDGEHREFYYDTQGRITKRRDEISSTPSVWREILFEYNHPGCSTCELMTKVTYPDGSWEEMQYDDGGNLKAKWWFPPSGSSAPNQVERWAFEEFDPKNGEPRTRLLEHELRRDAHANEDPSNQCNHPSCNQAQNQAGHIVHAFDWSQDGLKLNGIDYGSIQVSSGSSPTFLHREETFDYFANDGRVSYLRQKEDSAEVYRREFTLSTSGHYVSKVKEVDPIQTLNWTTEFVRDADFLHPREVKGPDLVTTGILTDQGGRVYWVGEDYDGTSTSARDNELRYDKVGRLVKTETIVGAKVLERQEWALDENGLPYQATYSDPNKTATYETDLEFSAGGRIEKVTDWRGWSTITEYGEGAFMLPTKIKESFGSQTRTIWLAGDSTSDGYDEMGRLLLSENTLNWEAHRVYDVHGRLKRTFEETEPGYFAAKDYKYDARGFLKEVEVGAISGSPSSITGQNWLEHHVITKNLAGHTVEYAIYENGMVDEARMRRFVLDGRGRAERQTVFMGDRSAGLGSATGVVTEFAYDARDRMILRSLLSAGAGSTAVEEVFIDHLDTLRQIQAERISSSGALKEKVLTSYDKLGLPTTSVQYEWASTGYTGASRTTSFEFDGLDRMTKRTDPAGVAVGWAYDELDRLTQETRYPNDSSGTFQATTYDYDTTYGYLLKATDAEGKATNYTVDTADWLLPDKVTYPDGRWRQNTAYDNLDRVTDTLDSRGITHSYDYKGIYLIEDDTNVQSLSSVIGDDKLKWAYDPWKGTLSSSEVWRNGSKVWETTFSHNDLGELTSEVQGLSGQTATWGMTHGYAGEPRTVTYPSGLGIDLTTYTYDGAGRLSTTTYEKSSTPIAQYTLGHIGTLVSSRNDSVSDIHASFGFDGYGRWNSASWSDASGTGTPVLLDGEDRVMDVADRVTSRQRTLDTIGEVFVHDAYGRMSAWYTGVTNANSNPANTIPSTWSEVERYNLNKVYGRTSTEHEISGQSPVPTAYTSNNAHFYTAVGSETRTTTDGYLNSDGTYYYRWDAWGKLVEVEEISSSTVIREHEYDSFGRRVRTMEDDGTTADTTRFVYWGAGLAGSFIEGSSLTNIRTYGFLLAEDDETLVVIESAGASNGKYELPRDFQGSILGLIDRSTKLVVERYRYSPFGEVAIENGSGGSLSSSAYGNSRLFLGRLFDFEVGLYDLRNRWLEPDTGSFISTDPLLAVDSWNMYQYGFAAPSTWMDRFGLHSGSGDSGPCFLCQMGATSCGGDCSQVPALEPIHEDPPGSDPTVKDEDSLAEDAAEFLIGHDLAIITTGADADGNPVGVGGYLLAVGSITPPGKAIKVAAKGGSLIAKGVAWLFGKSAKQSAKNCDDGLKIIDHARKRMKKRNVSRDRVKEAMEKGEKSADPIPGRSRYDIPASESDSGRALRVVQDDETGEIVTVIDRGSKK